MTKREADALRAGSDSRWLSNTFIVQGYAVHSRKYRECSARCVAWFWRRWVECVDNCEYHTMRIDRLRHCVFEPIRFQCTQHYRSLGHIGQSVEVRFSTEFVFILLATGGNREYHSHITCKWDRAVMPPHTLRCYAWVDREGWFVSAVRACIERVSTTAWNRSRFRPFSTHFV